MVRVLVIEDERHTAETISLFLERQGFECITAYDGDSGLLRLLHDRVDLVIIDWMLPGLNGLEICKVARSMRNAKIIMLSARTHVDDKVTGLEMGADDYLTKPFSLHILHSRIRSLLRRRGEYSNSTPTATDNLVTLHLQVGVLQMDLTARTIFFNDIELSFTDIEFRIMEMLIKRAKTMVTRQDIAEAVWGTGFDGDFHKISVHMSNIRAKWINATGHYPIKTVYGVGYKIEEKPQPSEALEH